MDRLPSSSHPPKRTDIQVLRAIAVLLVLLYHAGATDYVPRGYLGVDVFFVISGFLITGMIIRDVDAGCFSFVEFYSRRARRILPAAYVTFACTLLVAGFFLTQPEYEEFRNQLLGAVTFTANIVLLGQTGYFERDADFKPLLHTWSLSVEEQFYCLLPLFLVLIGATKRLRATAAIMLVSVILYLSLVSRSPDSAFFLLHTRAWELLLGSVLALVIAERGDLPLPGALVAFGALVLLAVPCVPAAILWPGIDSVLVTCATALVIAARYRGAEKNPLAKRLAVIGDWSYSLYLIHWPLFAFLASAYAASGVPLKPRILLFAVSFPLAFLQYRFVEKTTQSIALPKLRPALLAASALLLASPWLFTGAPNAKDYAWILRVNHGLSFDCDQKGAQYTETSGCATSGNPTFALWGDSYAMHLAEGLRTLPLIQMTKSTCVPLIGVGNVTRITGYNADLAQRCIDFNASVFRYLLAHPAITTVILGATFVHIDKHTRQLHGGRVDAMSEDDLANGYADMIKRLRAAGKKVVIVAFPPAANFDRGLCLERMDAGLVLFGRPNCDITEASYRNTVSWRIGFLSKVERVADVPVLWPHDVLCARGVCPALLNGKFLYRDANHLSHEGSIEFARTFGLIQRINQSAR